MARKRGKGGNKGVFEAVVVVILIAVVYALFFSPSTKSISGTGAPTGTTGCSVAPSVSVVAQYYDNSKVPPILTQKVVSYQLYTQGGVTALAVGSTSASAATTVTAGVQCNTNYFAVVGNVPGSYPVQVYKQVNSTNPTPTITGITALYAAPTVTGNNATTFGVSGPIGLRKSGALYGNGQTLTEYSFTASEANGYFGQPSGQFAVGYLYNASVVTGIAVPGCSLSNKQMPPESNSTIGNPTTTWFLCPSLTPNNVTTVHPIFTLGTVTSNALIPNNVIEYLEPGVGILQNGVLLQNQFYNTTSAAAPIAAIQESTLTIR